MRPTLRPQLFRGNFRKAENACSLNGAISMNVTNEQLQSVVDALRSLGARTVVLFGSMVETPATARDVDIAVEGIPLRRILEADVLIHDLLGVPTDLVSREENPAFFDVVRDYGRVLFQAT